MRILCFWLYIVLFLHQTTTSGIPSILYSMLYIVLFLHQTTTRWISASTAASLYIVLFLHQTTTMRHSPLTMLKLYIVLFLHQTTTGDTVQVSPNCCISYYSYIKPQPRYFDYKTDVVVYRTIPTSNHNL